MPLTEAKKKSNQKYFDKNWQQVKLSMPKAEADVLNEYCEAHDISKAGLIRSAIKYVSSVPDSAFTTLKEFFEKNNITEDSDKVNFVIGAVLDKIEANGGV